MEDRAELCSISLAPWSSGLNASAYRLAAWGLLVVDSHVLLRVPVPIPWSPLGGVFQPSISLSVMQDVNQPAVTDASDRISTVLVRRQYCSRFQIPTITREGHGTPSASDNELCGRPIAAKWGDRDGGQRTNGGSGNQREGMQNRQESIDEAMVRPFGHWSLRSRSSQRTKGNHQ